MKVDRDVVAAGTQRPDEAEIAAQAGNPAQPVRDDHFIEMGVVLDDRQRRRFDHVCKVRIGKLCPERTNRRCGEDHVANLAKPDQEDSRDQSSTVASSMSMTGMSSWMGYTRLHVAHLSAVPFLMSVTGV